MQYLITGVLVILLYIIYQKITRRNLPPGPIPWPFIGSLIEVARADSKRAYVSFDILSKKYGNVFSVQVGTVPIVGINGYNAVREACKSENFDNRIDHYWVLDRSYGKKIGLIFSEQNYWKETRKLTTRILREFGFGKKRTMESLIQEEFQDFTKWLDKLVMANNGQIVVDEIFNGPMVNVVWSLLTGTRFDTEDNDFVLLRTAVNDFMKSGQAGGTNVLGAFPFLVRVIPGLLGFTAQHEITVRLLNYFEKVVNDHRDKGTYKNDPCTFIDGFLQAIDNNGSSSSGIYTDQNLVSVLSDLFLTGSETSGNAMAFGIRLMVQYPHVQNKVRDEIDRVIGNSRTVTFDDKAVLKYTDATLIEILRFCSVTPVGPRRSHATCKFGPYTIPEGTTVMLNYYSCDMDESVWGDPLNFRPERFLNEKGDIANMEKFILFSMGKRNCIGENTARHSLFVGFCSLIQNFIFEIHPNFGIPDNEDIAGLTISPKPFTVYLKSRNI